MPICQKQLINFQFNLPPHWVSDIQQSFKHSRAKHRSASAAKRRKALPPIVNSDGSSTKRLLHIRLFDLQMAKHVDWDSTLFVLKINDHNVKMPPLPDQKGKNKKKKKKKAAEDKVFRFVQPLDISSHAMNCMTFEIACHKAVFQGAASIEIVNLLTVEEIADRVKGASRLASNLHSIADSESAPAQQCKICGSRDNLSRCSRCKATWYCSRAHQEEDWTEHALGCQPYDELNRLRLQNRSTASRSKDSEDGEVICDEIKVSIRDPLSLCRIQTPIRGTGCHHPQCVDLKTYLNYCHHTKTWQCPICMQPLMYRDLAVDLSMDRIIKEVSSEVDQVRLNPDDYSYKVVTLEEMQRSDGAFGGSASTSARSSVSENVKKRKLEDVMTLSDDEEEEPKRGALTLSGGKRSSISPANGHKSKRRRMNDSSAYQKTKGASKQIEVIVLE